MSRVAHSQSRSLDHAHVDDMIAALRQAGLRVTPQRIAICRALAETATHPTAQALFEQLSAQFATLSRATVYNTLETLAQVGLAQQLVVTGDGAMRFDANLTPHAHLVCTRCHRVEDYDDPSLAAIVDDVSRKSGYRLRGLCVFYHGVCPHCQRQAR